MAELANVLKKMTKFDKNNLKIFFIWHLYARHVSAVVSRAREWGVLPAPSSTSAGSDAGRGTAAFSRRQAAWGSNGGVFDDVMKMCDKTDLFSMHVTGQYQ